MIQANYGFHELKTLNKYFIAIQVAGKRFEIRKNDRDFKEGDILKLNETDNLDGDDIEPTGSFLLVRVTYITDYHQRVGFVVMGFEVLL